MKKILSTKFAVLALTLVSLTNAGCFRGKEAPVEEEKPVVEPGPKAEAKFFDLLKSYSQGEGTSAELKATYFHDITRLSTAEKLALSEMLDGKNTVAHLLAKGVINAEIIEIAKDFFHSIKHVGIAVTNILEAKDDDDKTPFEFLYQAKNRAAGETAEDRLKLLGQFVLAKPVLINNLEKNGAYAHADFNSLMGDFDDDELKLVAPMLSMSNLHTWFAWGMAPANIALARPVYKKLYTHGGTSIKSNLGDLLVSYRYGQDISGAALVDLVTNSDAWGIDVKDDSFTLDGHQGSLLYVVAKNIVKVMPILAGQLNEESLKKVADAVKIKIAADYVTHASVTQFDVPGENIVDGINASAPAIPKHLAKAYLALPITHRDFYDELKRVTDLPAAQRDGNELNTLKYFASLPGFDASNPAWPLDDQQLAAGDRVAIEQKAMGDINIGGINAAHLMAQLKADDFSEALFTKFLSTSADNKAKLNVPYGTDTPLKWLSARVAGDDLAGLKLDDIIKLLVERGDDAQLAPLETKATIERVLNLVDGTAASVKKVYQGLKLAHLHFLIDWAHGHKPSFKAAYTNLNAGETISAARKKELRSKLLEKALDADAGDGVITNQLVDQIVATTWGLAADLSDDYQIGSASGNVFKVMAERALAESSTPDAGGVVSKNWRTLKAVSDHIKNTYPAAHVAQSGAGYNALTPPLSPRKANKYLSITATVADVYNESKHLATNHVWPTSDLVAFYDEAILNEAKAQALLAMGAPGETFIENLAKAKAVMAIRDKLADLLGKLTIPVEQIAAVDKRDGAGVNALRRLADSTRAIVGEGAGERKNMIMYLLDYGAPAQVNTINNQADLDYILDAIQTNGGDANAQKALLAKVLQGADAARLDDLRDWGLINKPDFKAAYAQLLVNLGNDNAPRAIALRSSFLKQVYAANNLANVEAFITTDADQLGMKGVNGASFNADTYKLDNKAGTAKFEGSLLYVLTKRVIEDVPAGFDAAQEHSYWKNFREKVAQKVEAAMGVPPYANHATNIDYPANAGGGGGVQKIEGAIAATYSAAQAKWALNLPITAAVIFDEIADITNEANVADRVVSPLLESLLEDYNAKNPGDNYAAVEGQNHGGVYFIHRLAELKTEAKSKAIFELLLPNGGANNNTRLNRKFGGGAGKTPLHMVADDGRNIALKGSDNDRKDIINLLIDRGDGSDVAGIADAATITIVLNAALKDVADKAARLDKILLNITDIGALKALAAWGAAHQADFAPAFHRLVNKDAIIAAQDDQASIDNILNAALAGANVNDNIKAIIKGIDNAHYDKVLGWLSGAAGAAKKAQLATSYGELAADAAGNAKKQAIRNALLKKAYDEQKIVELVNDAPPFDFGLVDAAMLQLAEGFELAKNPPAAAKHKGPLLYVIAMRSKDDVAANAAQADAIWGRLKLASAAIKTVIDGNNLGDYNQLAQVDVFGPALNQHNIYTHLSTAPNPISPSKARKVLSLQAVVDDVYDEAKSLAPGDNTDELKALYNEAITNQATAQALAVKGGAGTYFIEYVAGLNESADTKAMIKNYIDHLGAFATRLEVAKITDGNQLKKIFTALKDPADPALSWALAGSDRALRGAMVQWGQDPLHTVLFKGAFNKFVSDYRVIARRKVADMKAPASNFADLLTLMSGRNNALGVLMGNADDAVLPDLFALGHANQADFKRGYENIIGGGEVRDQANIRQKYLEYAFTQNLVTVKNLIDDAPNLGFNLRDDNFAPGQKMLQVIIEKINSGWQNFDDLEELSTRIKNAWPVGGQIYDNAAVALLPTLIGYLPAAKRPVAARYLALGEASVSNANIFDLTAYAQLDLKWAYDKKITGQPEAKSLDDNTDFMVAVASKNPAQYGAITTDFLTKLGAQAPAAIAKIVDGGDLVKVVNTIADKPALLAHVFTGAQNNLLLDLLTWSFANPGNLAKAKEAFKAAYAVADGAKKQAMRNALIDAAYNEGADKIIELAHASDPWGVRAGLGTDQYTIAVVGTGLMHKVTADLLVADSISESDFTKISLALKRAYPDNYDAIAGALLVQVKAKLNGDYVRANIALDLPFAVDADVVANYAKAVGGNDQTLKSLFDQQAADSKSASEIAEKFIATDGAAYMRVIGFALLSEQNVITGFIEGTDPVLYPILARSMLGADKGAEFNAAIGGIADVANKAELAKSMVDEAYGTGADAKARVTAVKDMIDKGFLPDDQIKLKKGYDGKFLLTYVMEKVAPSLSPSKNLQDLSEEGDNLRTAFKSLTDVIKPKAAINNLSSWRKLLFGSKSVGGTLGSELFKRLFKDGAIDGDETYKAAREIFKIFN